MLAYPKTGAVNCFLGFGSGLITAVLNQWNYVSVRYWQREARSPVGPHETSRRAHVRTPRPVTFANHFEWR